MPSSAVLSSRALPGPVLESMYSCAVWRRASLGAARQLRRPAYWRESLHAIHGTCHLACDDSSERIDRLRREREFMRSRLYRSGFSEHLQVKGEDAKVRGWLSADIAWRAFTEPCGQPALPRTDEAAPAAAAASAGHACAVS